MTCKNTYDGSMYGSHKTEEEYQQETLEQAKDEIEEMDYAQFIEHCELHAEVNFNAEYAMDLCEERRHFYREKLMFLYSKEIIERTGNEKNL